MRVYDYETLDRPNRWCREGVAVELDGGRLIDTFWAGIGSSHQLTEAEVATAVLRFDTDDFDELDEYKQHSKATWNTYAPEDRETITSQHRLRSRLFIRKGAKPDLPTQIENASAELERLRGEAAMAQRRVEWAHDALAKLKVQAWAVESLDQ